MNVESKILSREISPILWKAGATVSTAESCTAGQISAALTCVPGSSAYFQGGVVCYSNDVKVKVLGVPQDMIDDFGAVSEPVVRAMLEGALKAFETTYAVAVTGFAGPGAGPEAPVGTIWIAVGSEKEVNVIKLEGDDGRDVNLARATHVALQMLLDLLKKDFPAEAE